MSTTTIKPDVVEFESETIRREIINKILYLDHGLRRGLNHDIHNVGPEVEDLVRYVLSRDKKYQRLKAKGRRSFKYARDAEHRRRTITLIVEDFCIDGEVYYLNDIWTLKVSTTDDHRGVGDHPRKGLKFFNDNHYHGRPKRDRKRPLAHAA